MKKIILTIDFGTQSVRAALFSTNGELLDIEKTPVDPYYSIKKGWAEQDPQYFWQQLCNTTRKLLSRNDKYKQDIAGMTVTTQRSSVINMGEDGKPLRPAIVWVDERRAKEENYLPPFFKKILKTIGLFNTANDAFCECEWNWLKQNQPEVITHTHKYLFLSGYLNYRLSGEYKDSVGSQVGYVPFDYKRQQYPSKEFLTKRLIPIPLEVFPELVIQGGKIGTVTAVAADESGIPQGLTIYASAADKATEIIGLGVADEHKACLSFGTMATVNMTLPVYKEIIPFMPAYPAAIPGYYNTEMAVQRGFWLISWFKEEFAHYEKEIAQEQGLSVESLLDKFLAEIPAGSEGLLVQPYWAPAARNPGAEARGSILGFRTHHTRKHVYKAVVEGILYAMKANFIRTQKKLAVEVDILRVGGGGSVSDNIMQMTADIFALPAQRVHTFEASSLGAAICVAVGLGVYSDFPTAINNMVKEGELFIPNAQNRMVYDKIFNQYYKKIYPRLRPTYVRMDKQYKA